MDERVRGLVLELKRGLQVPRERIFRALTEPAEIATWWGPRGFTTPEIDLDLRVGGRYRFTMQPPDGQPFHLSGEFVAIGAPSRLFYTFRWEEPDPDDRTTVVTLSLHDVGDAAELSLRQGQFATEARLALHRQGWTDSLDKLARAPRARLLAGPLAGQSAASRRLQHVQVPLGVQAVVPLLAAEVRLDGGDGG